MQESVARKTDYTPRRIPETSPARALLDIGVHWADTAGFVMGCPISRVYAKMYTHHPIRIDPETGREIVVRSDDTTSVMVEFADGTPAGPKDFDTEFLDYILAVHIVGSVEEAIDHINRYNTKHSEAILTENYTNAQKFLEEVDAAAVYVNASTRFTDGFEFGFGAEIGISTQKLHARGPMGLTALTTTKYIIYGNGQVR